MIRVGIVGAGHAADHHVRAARMVEGIEVRAVASRDPHRARDFASRHGVPRVFADPHELVRGDDVDAVVIALPPALQPDLAVAAFRAGKHVLCEKPLAVSLEDASRIEAAWRASGRVGMVNFCYRLVPEIRDFRARLLSGRCGRLSLVQVDWVLGSRLDRTLTHNWKAQDEMGAGTLQAFGAHVFDYLFHDLQGTRILAARRGTLFPLRPDGAGGACEATGDEFAAVLCLDPTLGTVFINLSLVASPAIGHQGTAIGESGSLAFRNRAGNPHHGPFELVATGGDGRAVVVAPVEPVDALPSRADGGLHLLFQRVWSRFRSAVADGVPDMKPSIACGVAATRLTCQAHDFIAIPRPGIQLP